MAPVQKKQPHKEQVERAEKIVTMSLMVSVSWQCMTGEITIPNYVYVGQFCTSQTAFHAHVQWQCDAFHHKPLTNVPIKQFNHNHSLSQVSSQVASGSNIS